MVEKLFEVSNAPVPAPLAALKDKKARFSDVTEVNSMPQYVLDALNIRLSPSSALRSYICCHNSSVMNGING